MAGGALGQAPRRAAAPDGAGRRGGRHHHVVDLYTAIRATKARRRTDGNKVTASVTVNRSAEEAYRFLHNSRWANGVR
ncbi:hypothetical protein FHG89_22655 [Micromonospora orduensis]|uniref:Uncharacterized protein n=1 Tax=Micromonospora orduensis TaxID=1420891 RepID=A0A5C4QGM7_9ACTN|nr:MULTISPECIES: hypothetical protein [Micromonospora]MBQ0906966.1 hypothetical protein [Micromonospora sp. U21]TNH25726.1 hypothetical protein FHG89_22655 [Micromonospora orduensis]